MILRWHKTGYEKFYLNHHGTKNRVRSDRKDPAHWRTGRYQAHVLLRWAQARGIELDCELAHLGWCSTKLEVHHKDKDFTNNSPSNLMVLCKSHHQLVDRGRINLRRPVMPGFRLYEHDGRRIYDPNLPPGAVIAVRAHGTRVEKVKNALIQIGG